MCGIAGIYTIGSRDPIDAREIDQMIGTMPYRGPDASGILNAADGIALGHVRLAILDLSAAANQPFTLDGGDLAITFGGEIYNYIELGEELTALGHHLRTTCDTEVLLTAYKQWGPAFVRRLNGMWSFAIYDSRNDSLFCSRDRFGIKPFYFAITGGRFLFASEVKALLAVEPSLRKVDYATLGAFLRWGLHSEVPNTFFASVTRLMPGHNLLVTRAGVQNERYWNYPTDHLTDIGSQEASRHVRELLLDSLSLRLRSDVPVGSTLSGGVDSSAIVCLLREIDSRPLDTYTAAFPGFAFDESAQANSLAKKLGMRPHSIPVEGHQLLSILGDVVYHMDSPTQCPAVIPLWRIMERMKQNVVVALEGQGADELFGGYVDTLLPYVFADDVRRRDAGAAMALVHDYTQTWGWWNAGAWTARAMAPWSHKWFRKWRGDESVYATLLRANGAFENSDSGQFGDSVTTKLHEQHAGGLRTLLHYGDAVSMAHSIESRLPFMDYRLVEFGFRLPGHLKVSGAEGKVVLKDAVRSDVPGHLLQSRRKLGFATPIASWFRSDPERTIYPVLRSERCLARGLFNTQALERAVQRHIDGKVDLSSQIFRWISTEIWFRHFIDGD